MDAYPHDGALYCEDCAPDGAEPFADGGGDADSPQHCDSCNVFLENPLTPDGVKYVTEKAVEEYAKNAGALGDVCGEWAEFYGIDARTEIVKGLTVKVDNLDDREGCVMVTVTGPHAELLRGESCAGCTFESPGDTGMVYAMPLDGPELKDEIETNCDLDGANFDWSEYSYDPPDEDEAAEPTDEE